MTTDGMLRLAVDLEARRTRAMTDGDVAALKTLLSEDLYYGHSGGYWDDKAGYLEKLANGTYAYCNARAVVRKVVPLGGDSFLIHGDLALEVRLGGLETVMRSIYLAVWRREEGVWRFVAHQTALRAGED